MREYLKKLLRVMIANRRYALRPAFFFLALLATTALVGAKTWTIKNLSSGLSFTLSSNTGHYQVQWREAHWAFAGITVNPPIHVRQATVSGPFGEETRLAWREQGSRTRYSVSMLQTEPTLVFTATDETPGAQFPIFHRAPEHLLHLSLSGRTFTPPVFKLVDTATPWVFFNRRYQTCIFAPATEILVSRLYGDGRRLMADGFNKGVIGTALKEPHRTIMIFGNGIRRTIVAWGQAFRKLRNRPATPQEASPVLRDFGYWTDNAAAYFYNYDKKYGYTGTLLKIASEYRQNHIHLGYLELDSWWYEKTHHLYNGSKLSPMNPYLPAHNTWNHFGGTWLYQAAPELFPHGLDAFHKAIGLPLVVHARWIAHDSPYHHKYHISGVAPSDRAYWISRAKYLAANGVRAMEQDWLVRIYQWSPQLHLHLSLARDFTHGMNNALESHHIGIIYCMETSRFLMEAGALPDVFAMRGSYDRFLKSRWRNFIYNSMFIHAVGAWPWSDVFMSNERGNMLLSLLSGGPVGVGDPLEGIDDSNFIAHSAGSLHLGDPLGRIDPKNIDMTTRADGRLVKPAAPLMPTDQTIVNDALGRKIPLVATTHTGRHIRSTLVFVYRRTGFHSTVILTPRSLGLDPHGVWIARNYFTGKTVLFNRDHTIRVTLAPHKWAYWVLAPLLPSRIAFFGDLQQMVPAGRQRIAHLASVKGVHQGVGLQTVFAMGEKDIPLTFYSFHTPEVMVHSHVLSVSESNRVSHLFHVMIPVKYATQKVLQHHKVVRMANTLILNSGE
ncbi:MAG: hypothetical protein ACP5O1_02060 [Phycisphaerae bacterium]